MLGLQAMQAMPQHATRTSFKPGQSGNPAGKAKGDISITAIVKQRLALVGPDKRRSIAEHLVDNILQDALDGKSYMDKTVWAYIDGQPTDKKEIEHSMPQSLIDFLKNEESDRSKS